MERELRITGDGSHTLALANTPVTYHSHHGAFAESRHIFLEAGFYYQVSQWPGTALRILEMGFGTGLNALLTLLAARETQVTVTYTSMEAYPLSQTEYAALNHGVLLSSQDEFLSLHQSPWEKPSTIDPCFILTKLACFLADAILPGQQHLVYFDAFAPDIQPELWNEPVFEKFYACLNPGGVLVTYCSKTTVRKAMAAVGFRVEKLPGPKGKREIVRAHK
ncbi:MAG TPA: tRNA (5-methylaminomethyl-2-thiouridine)(34)-methyltransferase MnmD [Sediminibacterium sp.]|nr:tRNA (5-methylaminomethyl-2-thiouridine)(34)-methyltransferase MnmD [Sediminibacterium sp.]